jgi:hypothetical protein
MLAVSFLHTFILNIWNRIPVLSKFLPLLDIRVRIVLLGTCLFCTVSAGRIFTPVEAQFSATSLYFVPATASYVPFLPAEIYRPASETQFSPQAQILFLLPQASCLYPGRNYAHHYNFSNSRPATNSSIKTSLQRQSIFGIVYSSPSCISTKRIPRLSHIKDPKMLITHDLLNTHLIVYQISIHPQTTTCNKTAYHLHHTYF